MVVASGAPQRQAEHDLAGRVQRVLDDLVDVLQLERPEPLGLGDEAGGDDPPRVVLGRAVGGEDVAGKLLVEEAVVRRASAHFEQFWQSGMLALLTVCLYTILCVATFTTAHGEQPMADSRHISLDEVVLHFAELEDPRSTVNLQHPLVSVVVIALMAVLAGASGPTAIAKWAALKEEFLLNTLDLPNGIPRKDVFRRVLMALRPGAFQACFANWLNSLRATAAEATGVEQPVLAVDGKTARRSHDRKNGLGALHSVSVWASEFGLSLGQVACAEKSNEITAIPELLRLVDIKGAIITIDAMGTQKAIAAQIIEGEADYVLALKGNQETLHQAVIDYIDEKLDGDLGNAREHVTTEKGHGREETRTYLQLPAPKRPARVRALEGIEVDRDRDVAVPS